jgi:hypothetical protein
MSMAKPAGSKGRHFHPARTRETRPRMLAKWAARAVLVHGAAGGTNWLVFV